MKKLFLLVIFAGFGCFGCTSVVTVEDKPVAKKPNCCDKTKVCPCAEKDCTKGIGKCSCKAKNCTCPRSEKTKLSVCPCSAVSCTKNPADYTDKFPFVFCQCKESNCVCPRQ
jgi:hypothetical protein